MKLARTVHRHVWGCLCLEGVPQQKSGSFHAVRFKREPPPYITVIALRACN